MQPHCFTEGSFTNFGDDLNRWLWSRLLPREMESDGDGIFFCGIGTILGPGLPSAPHTMVFSSGAGYGPPPPTFGSSAWSVVCVRGPLTARVLNLPPSRAASDGALLLRALPEFHPLPIEQRSGVVFMPHYDILDSGDWPEVCRRAGVEFLSPHLPSEIAVERIRSARLVLADAMHAAIVADSLRVPWVPLASSNRSNTFKWLDWALPLNIPYRPVRLPALSLLESVRSSTLALYRQHYRLRDKTESAALRHFATSRRLKQHPLWESWARQARRFTFAVPEHLSRTPAVASALLPDTARRLDRCAAALAAAERSTPFLSDEIHFNAKFSHLVDRLDEVRVLWRSLRQYSA